MSRAVTADHVLFDECVNKFRPKNIPSVPKNATQSVSYLLTSFKLCREWQLPHCTIHPSKEVVFPGPYSAFVSRVDNPPWVENLNSHLYGIALSSILTFVTGRLCKSTRDDYLCTNITLTEEEITRLALTYPVVVAGPGGVHAYPTLTRQDEYAREMSSLIAKLHDVPYKTYIILIQAIRLAHLSLLCKRDDFGLGYLLIVSAIEAVAQKAIKKSTVEKTHPSVKLWRKKATDDSDFKELLTTYQEIERKNNYLRERYIEFIITHAPVDCWEEIICHPLQHMRDELGEGNRSHMFSHLFTKFPFDKYPVDLSDLEIRKILSDSYKHRSYFIHRGEQPPHQNPSPHTRFFQEVLKFRDNKVISYILPNYELLFGIARYAICKWADKKLSQVDPTASSGGQTG